MLCEKLVKMACKRALMRRASRAIWLPVLFVCAFLGICQAGVCQQIDFNEMTSSLTGSSQVGTRTDKAVQGMPRLGIYDPHHQFASSASFQMEHVFIPWQAFDVASLRNTIASAAEAKRDLMVTVEPYTLAVDWRAGSQRLFKDIVAGQFDEQIDRICRELSAAQNEVYVRWGHEMEDPSRRYPWARKDAAGYVRAYRYFVTRCRTKLPSARFVWSPKGSVGIAAYFPGKSYVDAVGVAIWGLQAYDEDVHGRDVSYREALRGRYQAVAIYGRPIIVAEVGASGSDVYRQNWYTEIFSTDAYRTEFPEVSAVVYFNDKEPYHWPAGYGSPDWRLDSGFVSKLPRTTAQAQVNAPK
jgi:endoglucanase